MKIFIIGNTSKKNHLGSILLRAAEAINLDTAVGDVNSINHAPSMSSIWGKVFFRLAGKRPIEWWAFNKSLVIQIEEFKPDLVLVTGITPLSKAVFQICFQLKIPIVNYLTDSPWSVQNYHKYFQRTLRKYSLVLSTKKDLMPDLSGIGVKNITFLPFAYDPILHHPPSSNDVDDLESKFPDVCLVGGADRDRIEFVEAFLECYDGSFGLYGGYWQRKPSLRPFYQGAVVGEDFCQVIHSCRLNIGIVRRANKDGHSMRSYEIAACGGCGIYEDTVEHRDLFQGYPEYGFFTSPADLAEKCNWLLKHPLELEAIRQLGIKLIAQESNTYTARLKTILQWVLL